MEKAKRYRKGRAYKAKRYRKGRAESAGLHDDRWRRGLSDSEVAKLEQEIYRLAIDLMINIAN